MKSNLRSFALAAAAALASLTPALHAQTIQAQANVPFSFDYGTTHFSQGTYVITMNGDSVLVVRNRVTNQSAMVLARLETSPIPAENGLATFKKYGDRWFLEHVEIAGSGNSVSVYESKAERQAAHELALRGGEATQVALALLPETGFGK
ncbi:MAG: hypothetical protein WA399_00455 [Acidobacteriaceae bacterium]